MKYIDFTIKNYRAIVGPLVIDVSKPYLTPIVGVNESGKTTILQAIFAFDCLNDELNDDGHQLRDTSNLYRTTSPAATIAARVSLTRVELNKLLMLVEKASPALAAQLSAIRRKRALPAELTVTRNLQSLRYSLGDINFASGEVEHAVADAIVRRLPYILYFDDFRDKIENRIEVPESNGEEPSGWLSIIEQLFKRTDSELSVFKLATLEDRQRKTTLAKVQRHLNGTLTREWQNFRLDDREALEISIDFVEEHDANKQAKHYPPLPIWCETISIA